MFNADFKKLETKFNKHKKTVSERSKNWGKTKFSPNSFTRSQPPPSVQEAKPWQQMRNDLMDDEYEQSSSNRVNMNSQQAKEFIKHREQNHRRNVIETGRTARTTWETFDGGNANSQRNWNNGKKKYPTNKQHQNIPRNAQNMTSQDRNFVRRKLTKAVMQHKSCSLRSAIGNMAKNDGMVKKWIPKDKNPKNIRNKFRN